MIDLDQLRIILRDEERNAIPWVVFGCSTYLTKLDSASKDSYLQNRLFAMHHAWS